MSNRLKMSKVKSILALREQGWSFARIARELGVHRETVARHVRENSKPAEAPIGSDGSKSTEAPTGSVDSKSTQAPTGSVDSESTQRPRNSSSGYVGRSDCEPLREVIEKKLDQDLHAKRIFRDLIDEHNRHAAAMAAGGS